MDDWGWGRGGAVLLHLACIEGVDSFLTSCENRGSLKFYKGADTVERGDEFHV